MKRELTMEELELVVGGAIMPYLKLIPQAFSLLYWDEKGGDFWKYMVIWYKLVGYNLRAFFHAAELNFR